MVVERTLTNTDYAVMMVGGRHTGKTTFGEIYRCLHHEGDSLKLAHLTINALDKDKNAFIKKLNNVLTMQDRFVLTAKLNYVTNIIFVDDVNLARR